MVVAMARDIRVLVIKLADRLHNMRTLRYLPPDKQERKARETLEIYAPLAHRLGMNTIKWELEDLPFATLYPKRYDEIVRLVAERAPVARRVPGRGHRAGRRPTCAAAKIKATVTGRPKHYYSIYQKMIVRGRDFADIYDLVGHPGPGRARCATATPRSASIHARWKPVPGPVQGLHRDAEVQHVPVAAHDGDRSRAASRSSCRSAPAPMHRRAEYGIAAHWKYKEEAIRRPVDDGGEPERHGLAAPAARLAAGDRRTRASSSTRCASTCTRQRGLRLHARRAT